ncbi:MAG: hypothetical protein IJD89_03855 [Clostridia bacterium]|nr:hypothetical protein [Clostridia bacterium]
MILPKKHVSLEESMFGFGAYLLEHIRPKITIDNLWKIYLKEYENMLYSTKFSFDQFILTLDYLYAIGVLTVNEKGDLISETTKTNS